MIIKRGGDQSHRPARIGHDDLGDFQFEFPLRHHRRGAACFRVCGKDVGIRLSSREAKEQIPRRTKSAVRRQTADLRIFRRLHIFGAAYDAGALHAGGYFR